MLGVGATRELSLRVSVAALARVVFEHPRHGEPLLALERKATLLAPGNESAIEVKSQPFGGAVRLRQPQVLAGLIGDFHFDSQRSRAEQDFRLMIKPSAWGALREFCLEHITRTQDPVLETDPGRELREELFAAMKVSLKPGQYRLKPVAVVVEDHPAPAENTYAKGIPTARVYRIFEASISDPSLMNAMLHNSQALSDDDLRRLAWEDAHSGRRGWASAILCLPLESLRAAYFAMPPEERNTPILFEGHRLDETVAAVLEGISVPKYARRAAVRCKF